MAELDAVLAPSSANVLRDALLTLTKFSEEVFLEARPDYVGLFGKLEYVDHLTD